MLDELVSSLFVVVLDAPFVAALSLFPLEDVSLPSLLLAFEVEELSDFFLLDDEEVLEPLDDSEPSVLLDASVLDVFSSL